MTNLILAGGSGTRLWPLSRELEPKQFLRIFNGRSLLQNCLLRNAALCENFCLVLNEAHKFLCMEQLAEAANLAANLAENLPQPPGGEIAVRGNFSSSASAQPSGGQIALTAQKTAAAAIADAELIYESAAKNTAPAVVLACMNLPPQEVVLMTPSDHLITDASAYASACERAKELAEQGALVVFGIKPLSAHTGYGYIHALGERVQKFCEKPNAERAAEFVASGEYLWNSGMACFKAGVLLEEFKRANAQMYEQLEAVYQASTGAKISEKISAAGGENSAANSAETTADSSARKELYLAASMSECESISIDYALFERCSNLCVVQADFAWSDVGDFAALASEVPSSEFCAIESADCFVKAAKPVAIVGANNLCVIDCKDALLIAEKSHAQQVKTAAATLCAAHPQLAKEGSQTHRPWGSYEILLEASGYKIKKITVRPGRRLSLQRHLHRNEHWIVLSGTASVEVAGERRIVCANESVYIKAGELHRLGNEGKIDLVIIEAQVGEYTGEDDIERIEDDYQRQGEI